MPGIYELQIANNVVHSYTILANLRKTYVEQKKWKNFQSICTAYNDSFEKSSIPSPFDETDSSKPAHYIEINLDHHLNALAQLKLLPGDAGDYGMELFQAGYILVDTLASSLGFKSQQTISALNRTGFTAKIREWMADPNDPVHIALLFVSHVITDVLAPKVEIKKDEMLRDLARTAIYLQNLARLTIYKDTNFQITLSTSLIHIKKAQNIITSQIQIENASVSFKELASYSKFMSVQVDQLCFFLELKKAPTSQDMRDYEQLSTRKSKISQLEKLQKKTDCPRYQPVIFTVEEKSQITSELTHSIFLHKHISIEEYQALDLEAKLMFQLGNKGLTYCRDTTIKEKKALTDSMIALYQLQQACEEFQNLAYVASLYASMFGTLHMYTDNLVSVFFSTLELLVQEIQKQYQSSLPLLQHIKNYGIIRPASTSSSIFELVKDIDSRIESIEATHSKIKSFKKNPTIIQQQSTEVLFNLQVHLSKTLNSYQHLQGSKELLSKLGEQGWDIYCFQKKTIDYYQQIFITMKKNFSLHFEENLPITEKLQAFHTQTLQLVEVTITMIMQENIYTADKLKRVNDEFRTKLIQSQQLDKTLIKVTARYREKVMHINEYQIQFERLHKEALQYESQQPQVMQLAEFKSKSITSEHNPSVIHNYELFQEEISKQKEIIEQNTKDKELLKQEFKLKTEYATKLEDKIEKYKSEMQEKTQQYEEFQQHIQTLQKNTKDLGQQLASAQTKAESAHTTVLAMVTGMKQTLEEIQGSMEAYYTKMLSDKQNIEHLKEFKTKLDLQIQNCQNMINQHEDQFQDEITQLTESVQKAKKTTNTMQERIQALEKEVEDQKQQLAQINKENEKQQQIIKQEYEAKIQEFKLNQQKSEKLVLLRNQQQPLLEIMKTTAEAASQPKQGKLKSILSQCQQNGISEQLFVRFVACCMTHYQNHWFNGTSSGKVLATKLKELSQQKIKIKWSESDHEITFDMTLSTQRNLRSWTIGKLKVLLQQVQENKQEQEQNLSQQIEPYKNKPEYLFKYNKGHPVLEGIFPQFKV